LWGGHRPGQCESLMTNNVGRQGWIP
jgi:hypothetical protein